MQVLVAGATRRSNCWKQNVPLEYQLPNEADQNGKAQMLIVIITI